MERANTIVNVETVKVVVLGGQGDFNGYLNEREALGLVWSFLRQRPAEIKPRAC